MVAAALAQDRRKSVIWKIVVIAMTIYVLALAAPDIAFYWIPRYDFGINVGNDPVTEIVPRSRGGRCWNSRR